MTGTLTIGTFARATHLSVKTLHHYHHVGLLVPADIDSATGYRRYTPEQIPVAQVIRRFRDLDMPLDEIGTVLRAPDADTRAELIASHLARLEHELAQTQAAVASLRELLEGPPASMPIDHRSEPPATVAAIEAAVELADLAPWFDGAMGELRATLAAQGIEPAGPGGAVVADAFFTDEHGELTVYVPCVTPPRPVGRVTAKLLPPTELAVTVHHGSHTDIDRSYGAVASYVAERAIGVDGPVRERYLVGRYDTTDERQWRTEIGWPIFRTASASRRSL
ncbi:MAG TPA: MerR family transcriptional regulator [Acidimicrobiia bacterium]|nr:MerR family transcriptional regulator [Acidimicrobiia bacterium]